jgi:hypothetical protein
MEFIGISLIILFAFNYNGIYSANKFLKDNEVFFLKLKEDDYDFLVKSKYGENAEPNTLFLKRMQNALLVLFMLIILFIGNLTFINFLLAFIGGYLIFKSGYSNLKSYYKRHLHEIDLLLPYYLKNLEILIQHYTVPVAISKSIKEAPSMFREGLKELIATIDAGDSSIDPYMNFAKKYPVRDSMRMMRLLYRLGLGNQERKQNQLLTFAKTISTLQAKSRETKYKERLESMEKRTMFMLSSVGIGVLVILLASILQVFFK